MPKYGQYNIPKSDIMVNLGTGQPNNLNLPIKWFQSTCAKMSTDMFGVDEDEHGQLLQYGAIEGYDDIRNKMAEWLTEKYYSHLKNRDLQVNHLIEAKDIFMTNGNTGALHTLISKYTESTDYIIVENPTYFIAINMFKEYGLHVEGVNLDTDGINISELEEKIIQLNRDEKSKQSVLFYYMIPSFNNPTGITTSHEKRKKIAELCEKYDNFYVIADEVYHFLSWDEKCDYYPMADYHPKIVSLGSFSKILAPALRVGWIYQNTSHLNYYDVHGIVTGTSGLNSSAVLDSSGGVNPIGFKFIEYALDYDIDGIRHIDKIIKTNIDKLSNNCNLMLEYLSQFNNISYLPTKGGYFIWIQFKTIRNTSDFLKICEKNKVKFHPGIKFSTNSSFTNCIRLSFSYYDTDDLILGLERIMDSIIKYNNINVLINGASGKLGNLIKKEVLNNKDFNYVGDIKRNIITENFNGLVSYNSVIIDVSSNDGLYNLLTFLINQKINLPLIIGTTGLSEGTNILLEIYSKINPVAHITNFSEGIPLFRKFAKLVNELNMEWKFEMTDIHHVHKKDAPSGTAKTIKNEIVREVPINSIRTGEVIGEHTLELTNGSEVLKLTHCVNNRNTFAKGCINYIYWILLKNNGLYNYLDNHIESKHYNLVNDNIILIDINKELPQVLLNHIITNLSNNYKKLTKIVFLKHIKDSKYQTVIYGKIDEKFCLINYCAYSLLSTINYIRDIDENTNGKFYVNNNYYSYTYTDEIGLLKLPSIDYLDDKSKDNTISEMINQMTNLILYGVSRFIFDNTKYLLLELKDNIFNCDMLDTICTIINSDQSDKFNVIFINSNYYKIEDKNLINLRFFDSDSKEVSDNGIACAICFDYHLYHFVKKYNESHKIIIKMKNDKTVKITYNSSEMFIYDDLI
jgi:DNA-binding transcriptional MocR family regulator/dihydrodipicolinate reductase